MMPSANTVAREKPPPANRSYRLNSVPCPWFRRKSARAWTSTPGVAMCAPMRYTTRHRTVKRIFSFSSGTLNRLGSRGAVMGGSARDGAARLLDLRAGRGRHRHALHAELALHVTHAEQLDGAVRPAHQPGAEQRLRRDLDALGELPQVPNVDHLCGLLERVREAALGDAANERHLPTLEPGTRLPAGARSLALAAPPRSLADPRARPAPLADARPVRAGWPAQARQRDVRELGPRRFRPRLRLCPHPRLRLRLRLRHRLFPCLCLRGRHLDQVAHLIQHAPQRRAILLHHDGLVVLQAQRFEGPSLERGPPDPGTNLKDPQLAFARRRQRPVAARFALAVFPCGGQPSHGPLPDAPGTGSPRARRRAPWRPAAPA